MVPAASARRWFRLRPPAAVSAGRSSEAVEDWSSLRPCGQSPTVAGCRPSTTVMELEDSMRETACHTRIMLKGALS